MPMVGFGTWRLSGEQAYEAVGFALETGYRHIDTATMYRNEGEVGRAVSDSDVGRQDVFITTKLPPERRDRIRRTLEDSLSALGTDYLDLWLIHWPPGGAASEVWAEFIKLRDEGLTRAIGVSNYTELSSSPSRLIASASPRTSRSISRSPPTRWRRSTHSSWNRLPPGRFPRRPARP